MHRFFTTLVCSCLLGIGLFGQDKSTSIADKVKNFISHPGYFHFYWDEKEGKIWLELDKLDIEVLYVNGMTAGVGSNDIGLDRNQLGSERIVKFVRVGPKILMQQPNYDYRAVSDNKDERQSVAEAFATSVLWGFRVEAEENGKVLIDFTPFLLRDAHGVANRLRMARQGSYAPDASRSAIFMERTKNFPKNSEFEATVTFAGEPQGEYIRAVAPTPDAVTVRMHHSLVELPDNQYKARVFDPRAGYFVMAYKDYATPFETQLVQRLITRHRLQKKDPRAAISDPVEPIIYYLDRGAPEPIRSALIEGASWWNQAFEAAGYRNAFQVKVLPPDADPMDVRYNVINWVHRATRGWSYGSSVVDPRTGEIIKGHVLLGSLRDRQDFLIAQGLVTAYENGTTADPRLKEMALARLRQLSAHEVGHTLGLAHNYVASSINRSSVMDYPHPNITLDAKGEMDFSKAYEVGIGTWDKRAIMYGYQDFPADVDEKTGLNKIIAENLKMGQLFLSDSDARPAYSAHPNNHLWDGGSSSIDELRRMNKVREVAMQKFSEKNIPVGAPMGMLESVLVPLYLMQRYQVEAVSKIVGGVNYTYAVRGDGQPTNEMVSDTLQRQALTALLETIEPTYLAIPERIIQLIPPPPEGYSRDREMFKINTGLTFDPIGAAESVTNNTLSFLLNPQRLARVIEQHARDPKRLSIGQLLDRIFVGIHQKTGTNEFHRELSRMVEKVALQKLLELAGDRRIMQQVSAAALQKVVQLKNEYSAQRGGVGNLINSVDLKAHSRYCLQQIEQFLAQPASYKVPELPALPDGSPIGCGLDY
jgi:hypothetical protein